jgi:hypothetical protein
MNLTPTVHAKIVMSLAGESPLQEGERVNVVGLERDPNARWRVRISGSGGQETTLRPCLVGESRCAEMPRLPKLENLGQMIEELNFWNRLWQSTHDRKADAVGRLAQCLSDVSKEKGDADPSSALHTAWDRYWNERTQYWSQKRIH